jgi:hypothetical protein
MANTGREDVVADVVAIVGALRSPHGLVAQEQAQEVAEDATR